MLDKLFTNVAEKIKGLAKVLFVANLILSILAAIILISIHDNYTPLAMAIIVFSPLFALVSAWLIYGFGLLIEHAANIDHSTRNSGCAESIPTAQDIATQMRVEKLQTLREKGLISAEEYNDLINKASE